MKIEKKYFTIGMVVLVLLLAGYIGYDKGIKKIELNAQAEVFDAIGEVAETCNQVQIPLSKGGQINLIAVKCLSFNAPEEEGEEI